MEICKIFAPQVDLPAVQLGLTSQLKRPEDAVRGDCKCSFKTLALSENRTQLIKDQFCAQVIGIRSKLML